MPDISDANRTIAKTVASVFGGRARVIRYWDDNRKSFVDLLSCVDCPQKGVTSYSTIGTSDYPLYMDGKEYPVRAEFSGVCANNFIGFDRVMSTAAFCVINSKWFCYPGAIFSDVLSMYKRSTTLQHLYFAAPFLWDGKLSLLDLPEKKIAWLLAVPISESERRFAISRGTEKLEKLLEARQVDLYDLNRPLVA